MRYLKNLDPKGHKKNNKKKQRAKYLLWMTWTELAAFQQWRAKFLLISSFLGECQRRLRSLGKELGGEEDWAELAEVAVQAL